jgi:hypothetical protein
LAFDDGNEITKILLHTAVTTLYFLALMLNHVVMTLSRQVSSALVRFNLLGSLVRLTGLGVMTIGRKSAWQLLLHRHDKLKISKKYSGKITGNQFF